jgi:hypothetical protein
MKYKTEYFFCSSNLVKNIDEIQEIDKCIKAIQWKEQFLIRTDNKLYEHQTAYNKAFDIEF